MELLPGAGFLGLTVFTTETIEPDSLLHVRFFAPGAGIDEDPVTGSANGVVGAYVYEHGLAGEPDGRTVYRAEQGDEVGRPGRVEVELNASGGLLRSVRVGGTAVTVLEGKIRQ